MENLDKYRDTVYVIEFMKENKDRPDVLQEYFSAIRGDKAALDAYYNAVRPLYTGSTTEITDTPYVDTPSRNNMGGQHIAQSVPTVKTGKRLFWNGPEKDYGHTAGNIEFDQDIDIVATIPRYVGSNELGLRAPYKLVIYEKSNPGENPTLGYFTTEEYRSKSHYFGYKLDFSDYESELTTGGSIMAGEKIGRSSITDKMGNFQYGHECNIIFTTDNHVAEDQHWVCQETLEEKFQFYFYQEQVFNYNGSHVMLDTYGRGDHYQPIPLPGERIRDDGLVAGFRDRKTSVPWIDLSKEGLREVHYDTDRLIHLPPSMIGAGEVYDIVVTRGQRKRAKRTLEGTTHLLDTLADMDEDFYRRILEAYHNYQRRYNYRNSFHLDDKLHLLLARAYIMCRHMGEKVCREKSLRDAADKMEIALKDEDIGEYSVKLITVAKRTPTIGDKLTDTRGTKGIAHKPIPREKMPWIQFPNGTKAIADFAVSWLTIVKRMNAGQLFTFETSYVKEYVLDHLIPYYQKGDYDFCLQEILALYKCVSPIGGNAIEQTLTDKARQRNHVDIVMNGGLVFFNPNNEARNWEQKIEALYERFPYVERTTIHFTNRKGEKKTLRRPGKIATKCMMLLEKHPEVIATASSLRQHHGQPATTTKYDRYQNQVKVQAVRGISETEGQLYLGTGGEEFTAELFDRTTNTITNEEVVDNIVNAMSPTSVQCLVDRMEFPLGSSRPVKMLQDKFSAWGWELAYCEEDDA